MRSQFLSCCSPLLLGIVYALPQSSPPVVKQTTCGGNSYTYHGLVGYGNVPSNAVDRYGDTLGGFGSSLAIDLRSWKRKHDGTYEGLAWGLPDRGWNTNGTLNVQSRIQKLKLSFKPALHATAKHPSKPNLKIEHLDTILLTGPDGKPITGIDADSTGYISLPGFPPLPGATFPGDGFGGKGPGGHQITLDCEGIVLGRDNTFWISDEYGPYIYQFSRKGRMLQAIQPPEAYLPRRNGSLSFSAASPPIYDPDLMPIPADTETGRDNNQGMEALTMSDDGKTLFGLMQSALDQEGGPKKQNRKHARMLQYDISQGKPRYVHEYVVTLPTYVNPTESDPAKAVQSVYRQADIISITPPSTDIKSDMNDSVTGSIASKKGELNTGIVPLEYCPFIDFNLASELAKFGLHNGGEQDKNLLNEKWESLALVPVHPADRKRKGKKEFFLFSFSDNDYITQDGHLNFGRFKYVDESGFNVDTQALVFHISI